MGIVRQGVPQELALLLRERALLHTFIETGTYRGDTAAWAAEHFPRVFTVERSPALYEAARLRFAQQRHVTCLLGDSRTVLADLIAELDSPALFWLDAHWSGGVTAGAQDECPLLDEIRAIDRSGLAHTVLIDDARLFLAPPPLPHAADSWPAVDAVCRTLTAAGEWYVCVHEDVIIRVPSPWRGLVIDYCRRAPGGRTAAGGRRGRFLQWFGKRRAAA